MYSGRVSVTLSGTESTLTIMEVQESDGGVYQCVVEDEVGRIATFNEQLFAASESLHVGHSTATASLT